MLLLLCLESTASLQQPYLAEQVCEMQQVQTVAAPEFAPVIAFNPCQYTPAAQSPLLPARASRGVLSVQLLGWPFFCWLEGAAQLCTTAPPVARVGQTGEEGSARQTLLRHAWQ